MIIHTSYAQTIAIVSHECNYDTGWSYYFLAHYITRDTPQLI